MKSPVHTPGGTPPPPSTPGFEGPEKRLEIDFKINLNNPVGLRIFTRLQWQEMLDLARCTIISSKSNAFFDSYVLSESSLFIYPNKLMIKTCGTTTLLNIIPKLLEYASICSLEVEFVMFSRKNFLYPEQQSYPHNDWKSEVDCLNSVFDGSAYILGSLTSEHWYLYIADYHDEGSVKIKEQTLEIMMHDLNRGVAEKFFKTDDRAKDTKFPGIADLIKGSDTDEYNFSPCGYSMNGLFKDTYCTIHVTPEPQCSYASFETNFSPKSYSKLIQHVLSVFKPGSFTLTLFSENHPNSSTQFTLPGYAVKHRTNSQLEGNCDVLCCYYETVTKKRKTLIE